MENYIFKISQSLNPNDKESCVFINNDLKCRLLQLKNDINNDPSWDDAKRNMNEYEYIFSSSKKYTKICKKSPISRAYFKLWEILFDFHDELFPFTTESINTAHIAEGPGGFIQCILDFKILKKINIRYISGITLLTKSNTDNKVPFWKIDKDTCNLNNIYLNRKNDNIGDLYNINNIDKFISKVGLKTCQLVTADGGFDFSIDFDNQEENFIKLFLTEIYTASMIQETNGNFIIKVFDLFTKETNTLISILYNLYEKIYIIKPFTSRPANSEKYLVCIGFKNNNKQILIDMRNEIIYFDNLNSLSKKYYDNAIATRICVFNTYYTNRQIDYLTKTLVEAKQIKNIQDIQFKEINNLYKNKCTDWCIHYQIPH
jgi:23S rRNA U2552 (ribose-2'-O)-methylase RlmE/FtsJ